MPPVVIDLRNTDDQRDAVHRAVQALAEGQLVAIPTETVYGLAANALDEQAVQRLLEVKGRAAGHPLSLAIKSADAALDYVPSIPSVGWRMARRCWPGPLTMVLDDDHPDSLVKQLPASVREAVSPGGTVGLRVPAHPLVLSILRLTPGPLALTSANRSGEPDCVTAQEVMAALGDDVPLVLDDGRSKFAEPSSVVRVNRDCLEVLRSGVIGSSTLRRMTNFMILVVCTGNTCRSPMGEVLLAKRIATRLNCSVDELDERGVLVMSAGIAAMNGGRAAAEAIETMQSHQLDLTGHVSQPLTDRLVRYADLILTMTRGHRDAIVAQWPDAADRTSLVSTDRTDISDPIGGPLDLYRRCADQIDEQLGRWVDELDFEQLLCPVRETED